MRITLTLAIVAATCLSGCLTACPETGCRTATSTGGGTTPNIHGGYRDTNPDNTVRRDDGSKIITAGQLTDTTTGNEAEPLRDNHSKVASDSDGSRTVETGTVAVDDDEAGPPTVNDSDGATPAGKIVKPVAATESVESTDQTVSRQNNTDDESAEEPSTEESDEGDDDDSEAGETSGGLVRDNG